MSTFRLYVNRGFGSTLGNMLDQLSGESLCDDDWIEVEQDDDEFRVVGDNFTRCGRSRGICRWHDEVEDLDCGWSDVGQCFNMSERLRWKDVVITPSWFLAPSVAMLKEALQRVTFCDYDPDDI